MPTRLVREGILTSDRIDQLDNGAEVFYRRLLNKVDDHGLYDARPSILRANLYPLRIDRVREADCSRWMATCQKAGLILLYEADGKPFLKILDTRWEQRSKPKYPLPPDNTCKQLQTPVPYFVVGDVVVKKPSASMSGKPDAPPLNGMKSKAVEVLNFLNEKTGRHFQAVDANLKLIASRLKEGATVEDCRAIIAMKFREWGGDAKMDEFLRPKTLFNATNFAQYRGKLADGNPTVMP